MSEMEMSVREELAALPGNATCADCPTRGPQWASVTHGSLICLNCSGQHRGLGVHISFVRSLKMDSWTAQQIACMRNGGNKKMNDALLAAGVPANANINVKYMNNAAETFRQRFKAELDGDQEAASVDLPAFESPSPSKSTEDAEEASKKRLEERFGSGSMAGIGSPPLEDEAAEETTVSKLKVEGEKAAAAAAAALQTFSSNLSTRTSAASEKMAPYLEKARERTKSTSVKASAQLKQATEKIKTVKSDDIRQSLSAASVSAKQNVSIFGKGMSNRWRSASQVVKEKRVQAEMTKSLSSMAIGGSKLWSRAKEQAAQAAAAAKAAAGNNNSPRPMVLAPKGQPVELTFEAGPLGLGLVGLKENPTGYRTSIRDFPPLADDTPGPAEVYNRSVGDDNPQDQLKKDMVLIMISGESTQGLTYQECVDKILSLPRPLSLVFDELVKQPATGNVEATQTGASSSSAEAAVEASPGDATGSAATVADAAVDSTADAEKQELTEVSIGEDSGAENEAVEVVEVVEVSDSPAVATHAEGENETAADTIEQARATTPPPRKKLDSIDLLGE